MSQNLNLQIRQCTFHTMKLNYIHDIYPYRKDNTRNKANKNAGE